MIEGGDGSFELVSFDGAVVEVENGFEDGFIDCTTVVRVDVIILGIRVGKMIGLKLEVFFSLMLFAG